MQKSINKNAKGITLIALVVTIVILLILAGVSLNLVLSNNGIVNKAKEAKIETRAGTVQDERDMWMTDRYLSKQIGEKPKTMEEILAELEGRGILTAEDVETIKNDPNNKITIGSKTISFSVVEPQIGDYVNYTYDDAENYVLTSDVSGSSGNPADGIPQTKGLQWRVLNVNDDGSMDLISATPTSTKVYLNGSLGYNNGVYLINDICAEQYSNASLGVTARNLTIEDIEDKMNDAGITARNEYINSDGVKYGDTKTYTTYRYYPNLYAQEKGAGISSTTVNQNGIGASDPYYTEPTDGTSSQADAKGLTMTQNCYYFGSTTPTSYFDDSNVYSMIFGTGSSYWLASRKVFFYGDFYSVGFSLNCITGYCFGKTSISRTLYCAMDHADYEGYSLRPLVSLSSDLLTGKDEDGVWQIKI